MKKYLVQVEATATFTRTFEVEAEDEHAALAAYQAGAVEWVRDSNDKAFECEEDGDTARVYTDDGNKTLLIDVADSL